MAEPIRPNPAKAFGRTNYIFVPTIADPAAPTVAEVTGSSALDLTNMIYADGFDGVTADSTRVTAPRRIGDTKVFQSLGPTSYTISDLVYTFDPQAAALSNERKAYEKLPDGTTGYLVVRRNVPKATAPAAGQKVTVIPIRVGAPVETEQGDAEAAEVAVRQAVEVTNDPATAVAILA